MLFSISDIKGGDIQCSLSFKVKLISFPEVLVSSNLRGGKDLLVLVTVALLKDSLGWVNSHGGVGASNSVGVVNIVDGVGLGLKHIIEWKDLSTLLAQLWSKEYGT